MMQGISLCDQHTEQLQAASHWVPAASETKAAHRGRGCCAKRSLTATSRVTHFKQTSLGFADECASASHVSHVSVPARVGLELIKYTMVGA